MLQEIKRKFTRQLDDHQKLINNHFEILKLTKELNMSEEVIYSLINSVESLTKSEIFLDKLSKDMDILEANIELKK